MFKILLAEDDYHLRQIIATSLRHDGYVVSEAFDGEMALRCFEEHFYDLLLSDVLMPKMGGLELTQAVKRLSPQTPVLLLTALGALDDKERGFDGGADDYLVKPIVMKELSLHVKALLRRYEIASEKRLSLPHTLLDYEKASLSIDGQEIALTKKMFLLLFKLLSNPNKIFTREQLMNEIWGLDSDSEDRTVDTHIKWLREKVNSPDFTIETVRGLGYKAVTKNG